MILLGNNKSSYYQWDVNQRVIITDVELDQIEGNEVHFSSDVDTESTALVTIPYMENGVIYAPVPNKLLAISGVLHIYLYVKAGEEAHTQIHKAVKVIAREKPDGYAYTETDVKKYDELEKRIKVLETSGIGGGSNSKISYVTLLADKWLGADNLYYQLVTIDGTTTNSQVDLTPSVEQLAVFYEKDLAFVTENDEGVVTVYAIGQKPINDYTIQVTITEVVV